MSDVDDAVAEFQHGIERAVAQFVTEAVANLREDTPVDTGWARANWVPSVGQPFTAVEAFDVHASRKTTRGQVSAMEGVQADGITRALEYTLDDGDAYISNNVPYIEGPGTLNDGHSTQAPAGFVEAAVSRAVITVQTRIDGGG